MISETSPTLIFEACYPQHTDLIRQVWSAAHAHGVKMTEQAHAWLDEPEFVLTELLRVPVSKVRPVPDLTPSDYRKHYDDIAEYVRMYGVMQKILNRIEKGITIKQRRSERSLPTPIRGHGRMVPARLT